MASWDSRPIADGLLGMYFVCDILRARENVVESVYEAIKRGRVGIFKNLSVDGFWTLFIKLLIFRYGFFNLVGGVCGCDFAGLIFGFFGDSSEVI